MAPKPSPAGPFPLAWYGVVEAVQASADAKHIELTIDVHAAIRSLNADGPEHGVVNIRAHEANAAIEVALSDTGRGIPPDLRASIFEPFHQADSSTTRVHGGLGLGLSIVKYLVDAAAALTASRRMTIASERWRLASKITFRNPSHRPY